MKKAAIPEELAGFHVIVPLPIQWGDQDALGHVNNTVSLRWFESSRVAYLEHCGWTHLMAGEVLGPIVASVTCHYRRQLHYPDTVHVAARVRELGRSSVRIEHRIFSETQRVVAVDGESVVVIFNYQTQRPVRVPEELRQAIDRLENSGGSTQ